MTYIKGIGTTTNKVLTLTINSVSTNLVEFQKSSPSEISPSIDIACEPGASTWMSVLPLRDHDFVQHKSDFCDAPCL